MLTRAACRHSFAIQPRIDFARCLTSEEMMFVIRIVLFPGAIDRDSQGKAYALLTGRYKFMSDSVGISLVEVRNWQRRSCISASRSRFGWRLRKSKPPVRLDYARGIEFASPQVSAQRRRSADG